MKYLKYILGVLAILAIVFLLIGMVKPEVSYDCEIVVDKPLSESWQVTQDEEKMSDWLPGFQKIEHVSGTPGEVGAVSIVHFIENGEEMQIEETITDIVTNESISMTYGSDFMDMDYYMKLIDDGGRTKITSSTTARGNGMFSKSLMALIGDTIKAQEEANLVNLKRVIEENVKNYETELAISESDNTATKNH